MMNNNAVIFTGNSVCAVIGGKTLTASLSHPNWLEIVKALKDKDWDLAAKLADVSATIRGWANGVATVKNGIVYFNDSPVDDSLSRRILEMIREGFDGNPMLRFLENMMANPSENARKELYTFLEFGRLPITEDGYFLAYRVVDREYMSKHQNPDGTRNRNYIGDKVSMPREQVDSDKDRVCSRGLHFCSLDYVPSYGLIGTDKVMIVKINPRDVVSIPSDYNNTKGRCCLYEVIAEYTGDWSKSAFNASVYASDGGDYVPNQTDEWEDPDDEDEDDEDTNCNLCGNPTTAEEEKYNDGVCDDCKDGKEVAPDYPWLGQRCRHSQFLSNRNRKGQFTRPYWNLRNEKGQFAQP